MKLRKFLPAALVMPVMILSGMAAHALQIDEFQSPGGIAAWLIEDHAVPVVSVELAFDGGIGADLPGKEGTGYLLSSLLDEGAGPYDGPAFQALLQRKGISLTSDIGKDQFRISLKTTTTHLDTAFDLLRLALNEPKFEQDAIDRMKAAIQASIRRERERAGTVAFRQLSGHLFAGHIYGQDSKGDPDTLAQLTRDDILTWHQARFARDNVTVTAAGDITAAQLGDYLDASLGDLPDRASVVTVAADSGNFDGKTRVIRRDIPQSSIAFSLPGMKRDDPDYFAAYLINHVLGGSSMKSRLGTEIRVKRGLTYGIGSYLVTRDKTGIWAGNVATRNETVGEVIDILQAELQNLADNGLTEDELTAAKLNVKGAYVMGLRNSSGLSSAAMGIALKDLGRDYADRRETMIDAVSMADIKRVAKTMFDPSRLTITVVGNPDLEGVEEIQDVF